MQRNFDHIDFLISHLYTFKSFVFYICFMLFYKNSVLLTKWAINKMQHSLSHRQGRNQKRKKTKNNTITFVTYIYIYVYIYIQVCIYIYTHTQVTYTHTRVHTCVRTHTHTHIWKKEGRHPRIRTRYSLVLLPFFLCLESKLILLKTTQKPPLHEAVFILLLIPIRISPSLVSVLPRYFFSTYGVKCITLSVCYSFCWPFPLAL